MRAERLGRKRCMRRQAFGGKRMDEDVAKDDVDEAALGQAVDGEYEHLLEQRLGQWVGQRRKVRQRGALVILELADHPREQRLEARGRTCRVFFE